MPTNGPGIGKKGETGFLRRERNPTEGGAVYRGFPLSPVPQKKPEADGLTAVGQEPENQLAAAENTAELLRGN